MCNKCGSNKEEKRNIVTEGVEGVVEFDAYCSDCGEYLYSYSYGKKIYKVDN